MPSNCTVCSPVHPTTKEQTGRAIRLGYFREDLTVSKMISSCGVIAMPPVQIVGCHLQKCSTLRQSDVAPGTSAKLFDPSWNSSISTVTIVHIDTDGCATKRVTACPAIHWKLLGDRRRASGK
jgi:hypothetical protein